MVKERDEAPHRRKGDGTRNGSREWDSWGFPGILTLSGPAEYGQLSQDRQSLNSMPDQEHRRDEKLSLGLTRARIISEEQGIAKLLSEGRQALASLEAISGAQYERQEVHQKKKQDE